MRLTAPPIKTELPRKKAKEIIARDSHYASHSYIKEYQLIIVRGEGVVEEDVDGNRFLDAMAGIFVSVLLWLSLHNRLTGWSRFFRNWYPIKKGGDRNAKQTYDNA